MQKACKSHSSPCELRVGSQVMESVGILGKIEELRRKALELHVFPLLRSNHSAVCPIRREAEFASGFKICVVRFDEDRRTLGRYGSALLPLRNCFASHSFQNCRKEVDRLNQIIDCGIAGCIGGSPPYPCARRYSLYGWSGRTRRSRCTPSSRSIGSNPPCAITPPTQVDVSTPPSPHLCGSCRSMPGAAPDLASNGPWSVRRREEARRSGWLRGSARSGRYGTTSATGRRQVPAQRRS